LPHQQSKFTRSRNTFYLIRVPNNKQAYPHEEHMHRYACWAAARAAQRKWKGGKARVVKDVIEHVGLQGSLRILFEQKPDYAAYQVWHSEIAQEMTRLFRLLGRETYYGRSAKIIGIYVKTVYVARDLFCALSTVAYPPVDQELLMAVKKCKETPPYRHKLSWTTFDETDHNDAIAYLRELVQNRPFWEVERYWRD
jgi:hypothetical protein